MNDGYVVLGTLAIVGTVLVVTVALLFKRPLLLRGDRNQMEIQAGDSPEQQQKAPTPRVVSNK